MVRADRVMVRWEGMRGDGNDADGTLCACGVEAGGTGVHAKLTAGCKLRVGGLSLPSCIDLCRSSKS